ncbi:MAG: Fic family protein [Lachnospiraceae bacterium]|jgi:hypothetical protein|nr:Fic family protein [Lachnospiraceae bacterium]
MYKNWDEFESKRNEIANEGIEGIKKMLLKGDTLSQQLHFDETEEYIKKIVLAQFDISKMLINGKYNPGTVAYREDNNHDKKHYIEDRDKIIQRIYSDSVLQFSENEMDSILGNSLGIENEEEYERWNQIGYSAVTRDHTIQSLAEEETIRYNYENENNPVKKFFQSFKYKKLFKNTEIEDKFSKKIRELLQKGFEITNGNPRRAEDYAVSNIQKGISEYPNLIQASSIAEMAIDSLKHQKIEPINIVESCKESRRVEKENENIKSQDFRQHSVTLGGNDADSRELVIETMDFKEIPKAMQELQENYEELYNNSVSSDEYAKGLAKIYSDFIYIQPYEDGNKRTATCLLNKMFLSKGLLPPVVSLVNDDRFIEAVLKAKEQDYSDLEDLILSEYKKVNSVENTDNIKTKEKTEEKSDADSIRE